MKRHSILEQILVVILVDCALIVGAGRAEVIYSQTVPSAPIAAFSSNDTPTGQKVADNFSIELPGSVTVRSLRFIGGYIVRMPPPLTPPLDGLPADAFRIVFYADDGGTPGLPLTGGDFQVGAPLRRTPTGGPLLNAVYTPIEYVVDLGTGITVNPSTLYWISIVNDAGPDHGWVWARAIGYFDQQIAGTSDGVTVGPWTSFLSGGMFYELRDSNVPEPSSFGVFLFVIACGALWRRPGRRSIT